MGLPPPPRRLHGLEVFRSPARHGPKTVAPPSGLARFQEPSAGPVLDPKVRDCPSWVCFRPFNDSALRSASPRFASPGTFRPRGSCLLDGLLPERVRIPEGMHAVRGVRSQDTLCSARFRACCHSRSVGCAYRGSRCRFRSDCAPTRWPATFAARGAPRPPALRNQEVEGPCATQRAEPCPGPGREDPGARRSS